MPAAALPDPALRGSGTARTTLTHCPYCSLQCGMNVTAGDRPATHVPADFPTDRGGLCSKGWSSTELLDHPERLLRPLVRVAPGDRTSGGRRRVLSQPLRSASTRGVASARS